MTGNLDTSPNCCRSSLEKAVPLLNSGSSRIKSPRRATRREVGEEDMVVDENKRRAKRREAERLMEKGLNDGRRPPDDVFERSTT